jgi:hypothetical protein
LLGMSTMGSAELHTAPGASQSQSAVSSSRATRAPTRDAVGTTPQTLPTMRCSFAEVTGLQPDQIARTAVAKVECPACGAMRTLHPQGQTVTFPAHAKRLTSTPRKGARWIRHGTPWELSHKPR